MLATAPVVSKGHVTPLLRTPARSLHTSRHRHDRVAFVMALLRQFLFFCLFSAASGQRAIHWVIRVTDLEATLNFTSNVLGMKVLRHEENDKACELTCNGDFESEWSKTMVGYGPEDKNYVLELTYNYRVKHYDVGNGIDRFVIRLPEGVLPTSKLSEAKSYGYNVENATVTGPDGYRYELLDNRHDKYHVTTSRTQGHVDTIVLRSADPRTLAVWYSQVIRMRLLGQDDDSYTIGFDETGSDAVRFRIESGQLHPEAPLSAMGQTKTWNHRITPWEGRNALALPAESIRRIHRQISKDAHFLIMHDLRELKEKLGTLLILILRDVGGFELCLVSEETFDPSVKAATDYQGPDWKMRDDSLAAIMGKMKDEL